MVDPTTREPCPACGHDARTNQMGQTYAHSGVNGCPFTGTGGLTKQRIYPLKFDYRPVMTATAAYVDDCHAGTIRYYPDDTESRPSAGEHISMRTADGDVFGIASVDRVVATDLKAVFDALRSAEGTRYGAKNPQDVLDALNGYYEGDIDWDTEVVGFVYKPWVKDIYTNRPPASEGV